MINEKWEQLYMLAAVEVDGKKMPARVGAVREAIRARLEDLRWDSDHHEERQYMEKTLERLNALEAEARNW